MTIEDDLAAAFDALLDAMPDATDAEIGHQLREKFPELYAKYRDGFFEEGLSLRIDEQRRRTEG
jgi:hypothetical protein